MSDTLEDLKNRQAEAADRVQPAGAARPVPNAASADPVRQYAAGLITA